MVLHGLLQASTAGQIINTLSNGRILSWNDQKPDYVIPERYLPKGARTQSSSDEKTAVNTPTGATTPELQRPGRPDLMSIKSVYRIIPYPSDAIPPAIDYLPETDTAGLGPVNLRRTVSAGKLARRPTACDAICPGIEGYTSNHKRTLSSRTAPERKQTNDAPQGKAAQQTFATPAPADKQPLEAPSLQSVEDGFALKQPPSQTSDKTLHENAEIWPDREGESEVERIARENGYIIVDWEESDPENPRNWTHRRRAWAAGCIILLTYSVYLGSAIYTPSIPGLQEELGATATQAILGLTLFVMGYGIGALFLTPLQELPRIGRNPVYMATLFLFVIFQLPIIYSFNIPTILAFRFLTGFVGAPALATGGASMGDLYPPHLLAYAIGAWSIGAVLGPISGPVVGGFAAQYRDWRWPIYLLIWVASFGFVVLFFFLPETFEGCILLKRARRLRKLTGNDKLRSLSEVEQSQLTVSEVVYSSLVRPFRLSLDPALMFANVYLGFVYAIFYLWFEAFPIVYGSGGFGFSLSISSLPFLGFFITAFLSLAFYVYYNWKILPAYSEKRGGLKAEDFLRLGFFAAWSIPLSLFIFGWTAKSHWIGPTIGAALYLPGIYYLFQCILLYISLSYPRYQGSVLAGNDAVRSVIASIFPLFGHHFFVQLGIGPGCSLLAGLSVLMIGIFGLLIKYGGRLRARSKFAAQDE